MSIRIDLPTCNLKDCKFNIGGHNCSDEIKYRNCNYTFLIEEIANLNLRKNGGWIQTGSGITRRIVCSNCGKEKYILGYPKYCPECGSNNYAET